MIRLWALAGAWGALVAVLVARGARRAATATRARSLVPAPEAPRTRRTVARHLRPFASRLASPIARRRFLRRERSRLVAELPIAIDLLSVAVGAGCTPFLALGVAAEWAPPSLAARLRRVVSTARLRASLGHALDEAARTEPLLRPLADALLAGERLGAPVDAALRRVAEVTRADLRRRAEARARTVPVRLLFPLVFGVLPAFVLLTVVPTVAARLA